MNKNYTQINEGEKAISLMSLCFYVLKKWKIMLVFAVIAAILIGGLYTVKDYQAYKVSQNSEQGSEASKKNVSEFVKASVLSKMETLENYKRTIETYEYYYANSIKVKLDPNDIPQGNHEYLFSALNAEELLKAISVCEQTLFCDEKYEELIAELSEPTNVSMIKEVIVFGPEYPVAAQYEGMQQYDDRSMIYNIRVRHYNENDCKTMHTFVFELMESLQAILDEKGIQVEVSHTASKMEHRVDRSTPALGKELRSTINSCYDNMESIETKMSAAEAEYYAYLLKENSKTEANNAVAKESASIADFLNVKMGILGAMVGVACVVGYFVLLYLVGGFVHNKEEMNSWLDIPVVEFSSEAELLVAFLVGVAEKNNEKKIYLTSTVSQMNFEKMMQVSSLAADRELEIIVGNNILKDGKALQDAVDSGAIILFEKANVSKEKDVKEAILKAASCGINVLSIVLEK